ncbi:MAG: DHHA1 domain-containing protein [Phycisphaerae bacterium]
MPNPRTIIIYHAQCRDGQAAAYIADLALSLRYGTDYQVTIPFTYDMDPLELLKLEADELCLVDFSFKRPAILELAKKFSKILILDHHKTARDELCGWEDQPDNVKVVFDMNRSGAMIAFDHFDGSKQGAPRELYEYIQDRDLWNWKLVSSKSISAWLSTYGEDLRSFRDACTDFEFRGITGCARIGDAIIAYQNQVIEKHLKSATLTGWIGYKIVVVNATNLISEVCHAALEKFPQAEFAYAYQDLLKEDLRTVSLRSRKGGTDVSAIAKSMGGGGHPNAAGFTLRSPPYWWKA